jgi:hypothetical protein
MGSLFTACAARMAGVNVLPGGLAAHIKLMIVSPAAFVQMRTYTAPSPGA